MRRSGFLAPALAVVLATALVPAAQAQELPVDLPPDPPPVELPEVAEEDPAADALQAAAEDVSAPPEEGAAGKAAPAAAPPSEDDGPTDRYIVVFDRSVDRPGRLSDALERSLGFRTRHRFGRVLEGLAASLSGRQVRLLRDHPQVAAVVEDRPMRIAAQPLLPSEVVPAGVERVGSASLATIRQAAANVAVLDTGIDLSHPDLNAVNGEDCIGSEPASDEHGHGTHVAGTIGAENHGSGLVGVAPGTKLWAVRVLNARGAGSDATIICGLEWVVGTRTDADPANDIAVVNLSLGGPLGGSFVGTCEATTDALRLAICEATDHGVLVVAAAGNDTVAFDGPYDPTDPGGSPYVPAVYPEVLTVTAFTDTDGKAGGLGTTCGGDEDDAYAWFSNYAVTEQGAGHTIAAPGSCVLSTRLGGGSMGLSGTSMATPHVAAAAALCVAEGSRPGPCAGMSPAQTMTTLRTQSTLRASASANGFVGDPDDPVPGRTYGQALWTPDTVAPAIAVRSPAADAMTRPPAVVSVSFTEPMAPAETAASISLRSLPGGEVVPGTSSVVGERLTFTPSAPLEERRNYEVTVGTAARDLVDNQLPEEQRWTFRTLASLVSSPVSLSIQHGTRRAGSAPSLTADDGVVFKVRASGGSRYTTQWFGQMTGVPNDLRDLSFSYAGRNSRTCAQKIALYRWADGKWVTVDSRKVGTTERLIVRGVGSPAQYVSGATGPGSLRIRVRCVTRQARFTAIADELRTTYLVP